MRGGSIFVSSHFRTLGLLICLDFVVSLILISFFVVSLMLISFTLGIIFIVAANRLVVGSGLGSILCYQNVNVFVSSRTFL